MKNGGHGYTYFLGAFISTLAYLIGGMDKLFLAFVIFMTMDVLTGWLYSAYERKLNSRVGFKGLIRKAAMIVLVIIAHQFDLITGNSSNFLKEMMLFFLIGTEGISIIENLGRMGIKVPKSIAIFFEKLKGQIDLEDREDKNKKE